MVKLVEMLFRVSREKRFWGIVAWGILGQTVIEMPFPGNEVIEIVVGVVFSYQELPLPRTLGCCEGMIVICLREEK